MSKEKLLELVAPLSSQERRQLRELLDEAPMSDEEWQNDPAKKFLEEIEQMPPLDLPPDFSVNHDFYLHGGNKREP